MEQRLRGEAIWSTATAGTSLQSNQEESLQTKFKQIEFPQTKSKQEESLQTKSKIIPIIFKQHAMEVSFLAYLYFVPKKHFSEISFRLIYADVPDICACASLFNGLSNGDVSISL